MSDLNFGDSNNTEDSPKVVDILHDNRCLFLVDEIDTFSATKLIKEMIALSFEDDKKDIFLIINSQGGSVVDAFAIIDTMQYIKCKVHTVINGMACSAAGYISVSGERRYISVNSYWMAHDMTIRQDDYISKVKDGHRWLCDLDTKSQKILRDNTKLTKDKILKIKTGELWLDAKQAMALGIADKIWR